MRRVKWCCEHLSPVCIEGTTLKLGRYPNVLSCFSANASHIRRVKHTSHNRCRSDGSGRSHCHSRRQPSRHNQHYNHTWRPVPRNHTSEPEPRTRIWEPEPHILRLHHTSVREPRTHIWEPLPHILRCNHILQRLHSRWHNHIS